VAAEEVVTKDILHLPFICISTLPQKLDFLIVDGRRLHKLAISA
jgi:hypothetical protein